MTGMKTLPVILLSVLCSSTAHLLLKVGASAVFAESETEKPALLLAAVRSPWLWGGVGMHGIALLTWIYALGKTQLSFAYPFIALGFVLTALFAWVFMNEVPSTSRVAGMALVIAGLLLVAKG